MDAEVHAGGSPPTPDELAAHRVGAAVHRSPTMTERGATRREIVENNIIAKSAWFFTIGTVIIYFVLAWWFQVPPFFG